MNRTTQAEGLGGAIARMIADRVAEAVAEEREACAKECEELARYENENARIASLNEAACVIRARKKP